jgi:hypothetical protein
MFEFWQFIDLISGQHQGQHKNIMYKDLAQVSMGFKHVNGSYYFHIGFTNSSCSNTIIFLDDLLLSSKHEYKWVNFF